MLSNIISSECGFDINDIANSPLILELNNLLEIYQLALNKKYSDLNDKLNKNFEGTDLFYFYLSIISDKEISNFYLEHEFYFEIVSEITKLGVHVDELNDYLIYMNKPTEMYKFILNKI